MKEHKILRVHINSDDLINHQYGILETVMNDMSAQGWDVVCVTNESHRADNFLITFSREAERFPNAKNYNIDIK
ncbi:MAG: hypothetical protein IKN85_00810 [Oscillospiraceae bacterium]|nr:hypothetical protein [Oscillospiraceae bacterium]MBR3534344.1 hypothetical protein [Oscillospiraceae bacterium]MBR6924767.1 hypothetical protein [Oscillospiraceae bacterium]